MLNDKKKQIGSTQVIISLIVGVFIIVGLIYFWNRNNTVSYNPSITVTPVITVARINWQEYHDTKLNFSMRYPSNYTLSETTSRIKRNKPVMELDFVPTDKAKENTDTIYLTIYDRKSALSAEGWIKTNTTSYSTSSPDVAGKSYLLFNVVNIQKSTFSGKSSITFERNSPNFYPGLIYTGLVTPKYIFLLSHSKGHINDIYQKMLSSLTY